MKRSLMALCALTVAATAGAVPMTMTHSGRLLDAAGSPIDGSHSLTVQLTNAAGDELWSDTFTDVPLQNGYFALVLGSGVPLQTQDLAADAVNIGVMVDGSSVQSTTPVSSVPFAIRTEETRNLRGGSVEATSMTADSAVIAGAISGTSLEVSEGISSDSVSTGSVTATTGINTAGLEVSGDTILGDVLSDSLLTSSLEVDGDMSAQTLTVDSIQAGSVLVNGRDFNGPIVGEWYPSAERNSASGQYEMMTFDQQRFNSDTSGEYFTWDGDSTITFVTAGFYRVDMRAISYNNGTGNHFETWKNGGRLHLSHSLHASGTSWRRHATSVVSYFDIGDTLEVRVYCSTTTQTHCYHRGPDYTALTVQLMR